MHGCDVASLVAHCAFFPGLIELRTNLASVQDRWKKAAQQRRELAKHLDACSARMKALNLAWFAMVDFLEELTESEAPKSAEAQLLSNIAEAERATAESLMQCQKAVEAKLEQVASALEAKDKSLAVAKSVSMPPRRFCL
jgi:hypothetical protein